MTSWDTFISVGAIAITIGVNLSTVAYMTGAINARISFLEREMVKIELDLKEMRALVPALATIKAQLEALQASIVEVRTLLKKESNN